MAIAVALTTPCPYCIAIHKEATVAAGVTEQKFREETPLQRRYGRVRQLPMVRIC